MGFISFANHFPEIAKEETRSFYCQSHPKLPPGHYLLLETYCDEKYCDCRKVMFQIYAEEQKKCVAIINYGWEKKEFYFEWFGGQDESAIRNMYGLSLNEGSPQSAIAMDLLAEMKNIILQDEVYVERLKTHYQMFREQVDGKTKKKICFQAAIGNNSPCPCGSGKKFKRCCLGKKIKPILLSSPSSSSNSNSNPHPASQAKLPNSEPLNPDAYPFTIVGVGGRQISERELNGVHRMVKITKNRLEKKKNPLYDQETMEVLETKSDLSTAILELYVQYIHEGKAQKSNLEFIACCHFLEDSLVRLRFDVEKERDKATEQAAHIQREIAAHLVGLHFTKESYPIFAIAEILDNSGLPIIAELKEAVGQAVIHLANLFNHPSHPSALAGSIPNANNSSEFVWNYYQAGRSFFKLLPDQALINFATNLINSGISANLELAIFLSLHPMAQVRKTVFTTLLSAANMGALSSEGSLRLVIIRNWLPELERPLLDQLIKKLKIPRIAGAGAAATHVDACKIIHLYATIFDGSGCQAVWMGVAKANKYYQISILVQQGLGIKETLIDDSPSLKEMNLFFRAQTAKNIIYPIAKTYLDQILSYFLAVSFQHQNIPHPNFLRAAELLGAGTGTFWFSSQGILSETLNEIARKKEKEGTNTQTFNRDAIFKESATWPDQEFAASWFESSGAVDRCVQNGIESNLPPDELVTNILETIILPNKDLWIERLQWMAIWRYSLRGENFKKQNATFPSWESFYYLAKYLESANQLSEIPFFVKIAGLSLASAFQRILRNF